MIVPTLMIIIYYNDLTCNDFDDCMINMISGWWFQPLWKILVSWDDDFQYMENKQCFPKHQPDLYWWFKMMIVPLPDDFNIGDLMYHCTALKWRWITSEGRCIPMGGKRADVF
jgi:hypothetical protein